ncbi:hypothetical protein HF086_010086 [Spodoptera exigua]|uniref:DUF5641 domain-containing protein n=1 Tax=Spodoptera exigua TaxID=7107 RepID=A0A922SPE5_SPOEX|nr:hypothetical protein HF086_010086 [Spodoptera exigua]
MFWKRWAKEYVAELQTRTKWKTRHQSIAINQLALIKDENLPPLKWNLGRVIRIHPGADGIARVADLMTSSGIIRRAFSKICPYQYHQQLMRPTSCLVNLVGTYCFQGRGHVTGNAIYWHNKGQLMV